MIARSRPVWNHDEAPRDDLGEAQAVLYVGVAGSGAVALWHRLHAVDPQLWLLGSEGVAQPWFARELSPSAAARSRFFVAQRAPFAFYGFEAIALIHDAIASSSNGRRGVLAAARAARDRDSIIGRYSIDSDGRTTSTAYGRRTIMNRSRPGCAMTPYSAACPTPPAHPHRRRPGSARLSRVRQRATSPSCGSVGRAIAFAC